MEIEGDIPNKPVNFKELAINLQAEIKLKDATIRDLKARVDSYSRKEFEGIAKCEAYIDVIDKLIEHLKS
jgi:hypothetical protein